MGRKVKITMPEISQKEIEISGKSVKINSLIRKLKKDSKEQQWIQTADDEYLASTDKAMYADELLSFLRGEE